MATFTVTIWGVIDSNGVITSGSGDFDCNRASKGHYDITFHTAFKDLPAVVAQVIHDGNTKDGALTAALSTKGCTISTGEKDGSNADRRFGFTVVGV